MKAARLKHVRHRSPQAARSDVFILSKIDPNTEMCTAGRKRSGVQGAHLNPLGLFLRTSIPFIWRIMMAFLPY
jgi:hypothetical protein